MVACRSGMDGSGLTEFSGLLPLFPLPNVVLFPGNFLPLHIFEPRYREMVSDALSTEKYIGLALVGEEESVTEFDQPQIHPIACMGKIAHHRALPDGRSNILLQGLVRVRVEEEVEGKSYRIGKVTLLKDDSPPNFLPVVEESRAALMSVFAGIIERLAGDGKRALEKMVNSTVSVGALADLLCGMVELEYLTKRELLDEVNGLQRAERLLELIRQTPLDHFEVLRAATIKRKKRPPESLN